MSTAASEVGAPWVWVTPDWAAHPVIENYYGHARRPRDNSFYDIMRSPTNTQPTRTLAEACNSYDKTDEEEDTVLGVESAQQMEGTHTFFRRSSVTERNDRLRQTGRGAVAVTATTRKLGSFSYSYTTETSEDIATASPYSTSTRGSGDFGALRHMRDDSGEAEEVPSAPPLSATERYATWNRQRQEQDATTDMVPIPNANGLRKKPIANDVVGLTLQAENPQGGVSILEDASSTYSSRRSSMSSMADSPLSRKPSTTGRLRTKLQDSLMQIDERIDFEVRLAREAYANMKNTRPPSARESLVWSLLCGARTASAASQSDGLEMLHEKLSITLHNRALNQLQRHRRHVRGILQIVTSHNPDLYLTEKQLDSFESADAMLANDIKYSTLQRQVEALKTSLVKRKDALRHARIKNGRECFESQRVKNAMLAKLLEAVSWYRLVQTNSREESASTSVGLSVEAASAGDITHAPGDSGEELSHGPPSSKSSSSILSVSRSLQELQVERILNVLAGEDFYSDYSDLMCQPDWWEIAQAHFENLIFSRADSRLCQWLNRISKDVAGVSHEAIEEDTFGLEEKQKGSSGTKGSAQLFDTIPDWAKDPQPEQIIDFVDRFTRRVRKEFDVPCDVSKSLQSFVQRTVYPRLALLCFNQKSTIDCQRRDKLWRKRCTELSGVPMENLTVSSDLAGKIRANLPNRRVPGGRAYFIRAIDAFNCMTSLVPCDLLDELMYGVIILHHEAALVLGTTQFSVETFFPLLAYVLLHCQLPTIHAQLHLLENFAITNSNVNGEESYYVYCVHAAIEYVCNSAGLNTIEKKPKDESTAADVEAEPLEQKREALVTTQ
ncbi:hypothetical protein Poli38472_011388 [Pythium oligandrum]|uniref:VPS9 domain-containing protein n=1 Tax=Pythium oligandrum TaxID=41045 RepID=A0A8K1CLG0_PYTOL|nr:hypothetical protein Poli38472_011388 [Pythium oligandrum]|eukprot:TMW64508.1 hypothetical protein Poli38472_011388 [Pythium oligandrum]